MSFWTCTEEVWMGERLVFFPSPMDRRRARTWRLAPHFASASIRIMVQLIVRELKIFPADPTLFGADIFYARHLLKHNFVLWVSETKSRSGGGRNFSRSHRAQNFSKSHNLHIGGELEYFHHISAYFFILTSHFSIFPSYFPHISSHFLHYFCPTYSFIFSHIRYIFFCISYVSLHTPTNLASEKKKGIFSSIEKRARNFSKSKSP
mgnify:CR=1 FL=1